MSRRSEGSRLTLEQWRGLEALFVFGPCRWARATNKALGTVSDCAATSLVSLRLAAWTDEPAGTQLAITAAGRRALRCGRAADSKASS